MCPTYYENNRHSMEIVLTLLIYSFLIGNHPGSFFGSNGSGSSHSSGSSLLGGHMPPNGLYMPPPPPSSIFWPLGLRSKPRRGMLRRAVFSDQQRKGLEVAFLKQKYISKPERKKLAQRLGLKDSQVTISLSNVSGYLMMNVALSFLCCVSSRWKSGEWRIMWVDIHSEVFALI